MAIEEIGLDADLTKLLIRMARRLGVGVSETLSQALTHLAAHHGWQAEINEDEEPHEASREELWLAYVAASREERERVLTILAGGAADDAPRPAAPEPPARLRLRLEGEASTVLGAICRQRVEPNTSALRVELDAEGALAAQYVAKLMDGIQEGHSDGE